nr:MAG TPA: hypothetical protein [Caudoviricetes sp.]
MTYARAQTNIIIFVKSLDKYFCMCYYIIVRRKCG